MRDDDRLLIASAIDGDLPPADAARVRTLLAESFEAGDLYRKLKADRDRLAALPKRKAPSSVARNVAKRIGPIVVPSTVVPASRRPAWVPYTIAASVFLAVGAGILFVSQSGPREVAKRVEPRGPEPEVKTTPGPTVVAVRETLPSPDAPLARPAGEALATRDVLPAPASFRSPNPGDFLTAPAIGDVPSLRAESARLPYLFPFAEAEQEAVRNRLTEEFAASPAVRLDVFSRDVAKSLELFAVAARSNGVALTTLPLTAEQVKRKLPVTVGVYVEALTAKELAALMGRWAKVDSATKSLDRGHVLGAGAAESKELKALLGIDPGLGKRSKDEPGQSVAAKTAGQVASQIGKGSPKPALAMTFGPAAARVPPAASPEVKQFLEKRGDRPANAVPMLILLKPSN